MNGRDQATTVEQTDLNDAQNPVTQTTTLEYDGFGRLTSKHIPQQAASTDIITAESNCRLWFFRTPFIQRWFF